MKKKNCSSVCPILGLTVLVGLATSPSTVAQDPPEEQRVLFIAENESGKVWSNLALTYQRKDEPYLPMVIAVENHAQNPVTFDRGSFWLNDLDDIVYTLPSVKELRKNYDKSAMDYRMVSFAGIPWETWRWNRRLESANFFPNLRSPRGSTVRDRVTLRQRHALVDLLYFERPRNMAPGRPIFLNVRPENGWEVPIRIRLLLQ